MPEALSQAEIDALREVVKSGADLGAGDKGSAPPAPSDKVKVVEYDFRKPRLISAEHMHMIQLLHEGLAKGFEGSLGAMMKAQVDVKLVSMDQLTYGELLLGMSNPACIMRVMVGGELGSKSVELGMPVATAFIDLLLGGEAAEEAKPRELSVLDRKVLDNVLKTIVTQIKEAWIVVADVGMEMADLVSNPEYLQLATPETPCLGLTFDVHVAAVSGVISICYPISLLQGLFKIHDDKDAKPEKAGASGMLKVMGDVPLRVRAVLGSAVVLAEDLGRLKVGDVICMEKPVDTPVEIKLNNMSLFVGQIGRRRDKLAVGVLGYTGPADGTKK